MADVQMVLRWGLGCFTVDLPVCGSHTQLTRLGERLKVVGRHRPEMKVWLISKQPAVDHNICLAGPDWQTLPLDIKSMIPFIILRSFSLMNNCSSVFHPTLGFFTDLPLHPPSTAVARLPYHQWHINVRLKVICEKTATVNRLVKKTYPWGFPGKSKM